MKELAELIADLAREAAKVEGGAHEGVIYTNSNWRSRLEDIARRADALSNKLTD